MRVDATSHEDASERILRWARQGESRYVCVASVNNVMQARDDPQFLRLMNDADLVTSDGMPLVWALRALGLQGPWHVRGTDLTAAVLWKAAREGIPVGFYGTTPDVLEELQSVSQTRWPGLRVAYAVSPPFRELSAVEDEQFTSDIEASGARILFVATGCPKQEQWMAAHRGRVASVMVGVGAALDFLAGKKRQAPRAMQEAGLEWLFRLATEPRRLWRRYLKQNPRFVGLLCRQLLWDRRDGHIPATESGRKK